MLKSGRQIDGILTNVQTIDGELVSDGNELFTVSSRKTYVRGEVNEEDVGEVKPGMKAKGAIVRLPHAHVHGRASRQSSPQPIQPRSAIPLCWRWKIRPTT